MEDMSKLKPYILPVLSGYALYLVQSLFWGFTTIYGPLANMDGWLIASLLPDNREWFYLIIYTRDSLINITLATPFAIPFLKLKNNQRWLALVLVVLPIFIYSYSLILFNFQSVHLSLLSSIGFYYGVIISLGLLPFAVWLVSRFKEAKVVINV
jgi:hypothetical protein